MSLRVRTAVLLWLVLISAGVAACASGGGAPRPRPFPGAPAPPARAGEPAATTPSETALAGRALVSTALSLRGIPYVNGGSEPSRGFDCSGLVQWVFAQHGTTVPREVREQYDTGTAIEADDVRAGDLVFFTTVSRGASHVGIALGTGEFVHAPSSRGVVRVERYTSGYWAGRWVGARRIGVIEARTD